MRLLRAVVAGMAAVLILGAVPVSGRTPTPGADLADIEAKRRPRPIREGEWLFGAAHFGREHAPISAVTLEELAPGRVRELLAVERHA